MGEKKRGKREESMGFIAMVTGREFMDLKAPNRGEKSMGGWLGRFPFGEEDNDVMHDVIHSFSFLLISVKSNG